MTKKEIFEKVRTHLLAQNEKSYMKDVAYSKCRYRTDDGLKCAIGCLIPNEKYDFKFETTSFIELFLNQLKFLLPEDLEEPDGVMFLRNLQVIHDAYSPSEWTDRLEKFREENKL